MILTIYKLGALLAFFAFTFLIVQQISNAVVSQRMRRDSVNKRLSMLRSGLSREGVANLIRSRNPYAQGGSLIGQSLFRFHRICSIAAIRMPPMQVLLAMGGAVFVLFVGLAMFSMYSGTKFNFGVILILATFSFALGVGVPLFYLSRRAQRETRRMEEQFPIALDIFTRALRSGHPVPSAMELLTKEMTDPIGSEFGIVYDEVSYGSDLNTALHDLAERWQLSDLRMFAVSLSVQSETGGNLAEILTNLSQVIRDRASMYLKVRALSSEGRMSAWMLSVLPVLTFVILFSINPEFFLDVAQDPIFIYGFIGLLFLYFIGIMWLRRMIDLKV